MTNSPIVLTECTKVAVRENERAVFETFREALQLYKPDEIMLSFNGGKDCTVLLHLLAKFYREVCLQHLAIPVLYIQSDDTFEEIEAFVQDCATRYNIELIVRKGCIRRVLTELCAQMPNVKAVFMGSRRADPFCNKMLVMHPTDPGWPELMRINPIIDWTHRDIWNYINAKQVPYCSLYNEGYTSLGHKSTTRKNPHLKVVNHETGSVEYLPAYKLADDDKLERAGRG